MPLPPWWPPRHRSGLDVRDYDGEIPAPGRLIAEWPLDPALSVRGAARADRILYSTLDQHGAAAVSTAAAFVPRGAPPQGGWPVLAWAHGTVGLGDDCTPSALPRSERDDDYLSHWLDQGYLVVATGTPANSYTAYILAGLREARPDLDVDRVLTSAGAAAVEQAETLCKPRLDAALATLGPPEFFAAPLTTLPGVDEALDAYVGTPVTGYDRPIFLGVGLRDRDVPPSSTLAFYDALTANRQPVELHVYPDEDHGGTVLASLADSTPFLRAVFAPH